MTKRSVNLAIIERRRNLEVEKRDKARTEDQALQASLRTAQDVAKGQGVELEVLDGGRINTARDGFTWLCGSRKRKAQLSEAQISAGVNHRKLLDAVHLTRITADYGGTGGGSYQDPETRMRLRMDAIERLEAAEKVLTAAHPSMELVVRLVVKDGWTTTRLAEMQKREDAVVLEVLRMGLDKLALHYGYASSGR